LEAIGINLGQVLDLEELVVELQTGDLGRHRFVVFSFEILELKLVKQGLVAGFCVS